jgi:hypothetical protein
MEGKLESAEDGKYGPVRSELGACAVDCAVAWLSLANGGPSAELQSGRIGILHAKYAENASSFLTQAAAQSRRISGNYRQPEVSLF